MSACNKNVPGFYGYKRTILILVFLLAISLAETIFQIYVGCIKYDHVSVLFSEQYSDDLPDNGSSWFLISVVVLDWINWVLLVIVTLFIIYLYFQIAQTESSESDVPDFSFHDEMYDQFSERKSSKFSHKMIANVSFFHK